MEVIYKSAPIEANKRNLCSAQQKLNDMIETKEFYWKHKANIKWLVEGERNTRFFSPNSPTKQFFYIFIG